MMEMLPPRAEGLVKSMLESAKRQIERNLTDMYGTVPPITDSHTVRATLTNDTAGMRKRLNLSAEVHFRIEQHRTEMEPLALADSDRLRPVSPVIKTETLSSYTCVFALEVWLDDMEIASSEGMAWNKVMESMEVKLHQIEGEIVPTASDDLRSEKTAHHKLGRTQETVAPPRPKAHSKPTAKKSAPKVTHDEGFGAW